jgi:CheY-like chemotaxis protein
MFQHILVVDDQPADQMLARYAIRRYNADAVIYEAMDGVEALEVLKSLPAPPDIIFLDINMPRMNGFEFLETYQALEAHAPVLVMLTSSSQDADRERCAAFSTVAGYETKPIDVEMLTRLEPLLES